MGNNKIAEQSKEWILESLLDLMKEKKFSNIKIKEITDKADLSRRTFYRNFSCKEDVLEMYFCHICEDYIKVLLEEKYFTYENISKVFFCFWMKKVKFLDLLNNNDLNFLFLEKLNMYVLEVYEMTKGQINVYEDEEALKYTLSYSVGGLWNVLMMWLKGDRKKTALDLSKVVTRVKKIAYE